MNQAEKDTHKELTNTPVTIKCLMPSAKVKANEQIGNKPSISYIQTLQYEDIFIKSHLPVGCYLDSNVRFFKYTLM